ncbi:unnamed protein product, partial [Closterium sp. NIES-53]
ERLVDLALLPASAQQHTVECPVPQQRRLLQPVEALQQLTHPAGPIVKVVRLVEVTDGDDVEENPQRDVAAYRRVRLVIVGTAHLREALHDQPRLLALDGAVDAVLGRQHPPALHDVHPAWAFDRMRLRISSSMAAFTVPPFQLAIASFTVIVAMSQRCSGSACTSGLSSGSSSSSLASLYNRSSSTSSYTVVKAAGGRQAWKLSRSGGRRV